MSKTMQSSYRARAASTIAVAVMLVVSALYAAVSYRLAHDYGELETQAVVALGTGSGRWMDASQSDLEQIVADWSRWDATYRYIVDRNDEYASDTLNPSSMAEIGLDSLAYVTLSGEMVFGQTLDPDGAPIPLRPTFAAEITQLVRENAAPDADAMHSGLMSIGQDVYRFVAKPILRSDASGPARGWVVMTRLVGPDDLAELGETVGATARLCVADETHTRCRVNGTFVSEAVCWLIHSDETSEITLASTVLPGQRPVAVTLRYDRAIHLAEQSARRYLAAVLVLLGVLLAAALYVQAVRLRYSEMQRRRTEMLNHTFVEQTTDAVVMLRPSDGLVLHANGAADVLLRAPLSRRTAGPAPGVCLAGIVSVESGPQLSELEPGLDGEELCLRTQDGTRVDVEVRTALVLDDDGEPVLCLGMRDIRERKEAEAQVRHMAYHDALTGLPNRILFQDRLATSLERARRRSTKLAVLFVDLDLFKHVNDRFGHHAGDELLGRVAERLTGVIRSHGTVARQGGDEFLVLLPEVIGADDVRHIGSKILETLTTPVCLSVGAEILLSGSVGAAMFPTDGVDASALVRGADLAMYEAKSRGRNSFVFYDDALSRQAAEEAQLKEALARAVERRELLVHYQPQVDSRTGELAGLEALVRWHSPEYGLVGPARFIPLAEESGLILAIGNWVLEEVCRQIAEWTAGGLHVPRVAVNLSARQIGQPDLMDTVMGCLDRAAVDPGQIELEVTESLAMQDPARTLYVLQEFKEAGIAVALDDFGTGYSSLAYLRQYPFDRVKIDREFLKNLATSDTDQALVQSIVALAHSLRLEVVAEGVETSAHVQILTSFGCDILQGFGLSRPVPAADIRSLLETREPLLDRLLLPQAPPERRRASRDHRVMAQA